MRVYVAVIGLLALGALFACLGAWQLARADVSRATLAAFEAGAAEPVRAALPRSLDEERRFERVQVRGEYELEPQFLLDNMLHDGVAGYHVLSALRVHGLRERVLVNRGWVPVGADRRVLPEVAVSPGERTVVGRLERLPRPGIRLGEDSASGAPEPLLVLQYPTAQTLAARLGEPVLDYQLLLDAAAPDGYVREWRAPVLPPERHLGYAVQWWALGVGAVAAGLVLGLRTLRRTP